MIKAVFFDFDGTISDARDIAYESMVRSLDDFGYNFDEKLLRNLMGIKLHLILKKLGLDVRSVDIVHKRFYKYFIKGAKDGLVKPCVSVKPLWEMRKAGVPLIVVSNSSTRFLKTSVKTLKIKGLFNKIYGSDKFTTKDELLKKLFKKMKIKPSEAAYIGDRFSDVKFARDAGCIAIAIHNKCAWSSMKLIKKEKPDYIIKDFRGLKKIIKDSEESEK